MTAEHISPLGGLNEVLGIELTEASADTVKGRLTTDRHHQQPYGIVHGGTYCALVETLASTGGALWAMANGMQGVVGVSNTTDFLRSHREGGIRGIATPIHRGRTQQIWEVLITREADNKLLARGQVRLQNLTDPEVIGGFGS
ncbi:MAG: PaaI family thioesterase [Acidimicrobiia bacterium]|nr:PaaI family thioesterase [Acidimicrobiia bacterium]